MERRVYVLAPKIPGQTASAALARHLNPMNVMAGAAVLYPLSSHLLLNPMIAAATMSLSSLSMIANALRLRSMKMGS